MTVEQLVERLHKCNPDVPVVIEINGTLYELEHITEGNLKYLDAEKVLLKEEAVFLGNVGG